MFWVIVVADVDVFVYSRIITRFITLRLAYFCYKQIIQQKYVSFLLSGVRVLKLIVVT